MAYLIAVTGGIGAGKSVVCRILTTMGYEVYDCDFRAKAIMDGDCHIKRRIAEEVCRESIGSDGKIDRRVLGAHVFNNKEALSALNAITHAAVRADFRHWAQGKKIGFVETAIFNESGLDKMVNEVWVVEAPEEVRISRVMTRSNLTREEVLARIHNQSTEILTTLPTRIIVNDGRESLLEQTLGLCRAMNNLKDIPYK